MKNNEGAERERQGKRGEEQRRGKERREREGYFPEGRVMLFHCLTFKLQRGLPRRTSSERRTGEG